MADVTAAQIQAPSPHHPAGHDEPAHDAFISYSRKDTVFAARLEKALEKYTPPAGLGRQRRRLRAFRDQQDFTGTDYYASIQRHLAGARKLIVVCSPEAASSSYVNDEIERFVLLRGAAHLVPVLWRGRPNNEAGTGQEGEHAFPPALVRALEMPLAADFRGSDAHSGRLDAGVNESAWMLLLANLLEVGRAEIEQRELQRRRRTRRAWTAGVGAVFSALLALTVWALFEGERALARQLAAQAALAGELNAEQVERRVLLARESVQRLKMLGQPTLEAESALRDALAETPRRRLALPAGDRVVAFSADGNHLLAADGRRLFVHSLASRGSVREVPLERPLRWLTSGADLRFVAGIDDAGAVRVWSWPDLTLVTALPPQLGAAPIQCLALADGGATAVALRVTAGKTPGAELLRWRLDETTLTDSGSVTFAHPLQARVGERCMIAGKHSTTGGGAVLATMERPSSSDGMGAAVTILRWPFRSVGSMAMAGPRAEPIGVWPDVLMGELDHNGDAVLLSEDGEVLRNGGLNERRVGGVPKWSSAQALAPGGAWLVASQGLEDPYVPLLKSTRFDIVDTSNGAVTQSVGDHAGQALFTPDGLTLVTIAGARLRLWDRRDGRERLRLFAAAPVERVLFDPSSRQLAAVAAGGALEVFDIGAPDETARAASGLLLAPLGAQAMAVAEDRRLMFTSGDGTLPQRLPLDRHVHSLQASPDGRWLALGTVAEAPLVLLGDPPNAEVWLVHTGTAPAVRWRGPAARHLRFDRASRRLLAVGEDGTVRMLDLSGPSLAWQRRLEPAKALTYVGPYGSRYQVALSDDGDTVAIGSADGLVLLSGRDGGVRRRDSEPTYALAVSADGRLLARLAAKDKLEVLLAADGRHAVQLDRRGVASVRELMFSPGAKRLVAIGGTSFSTFLGGHLFAEEHLVVWDLDRGQPELRLPDSRIDAGDYQTNIGARGDERRQLSALVWNLHTREVAGILYPSMLAYWTVPSTMVRGRLTAWRLTDDGLVETYRAGDRDSVTTSAFAAGGGALLANGSDEYQRVIDLSRSRLVTASCAAVERKWTEIERRQHLSGIWRRPLRCDILGEQNEIDATMATLP